MAVKPRPCAFCGETFTPLPKHASAKWCLEPECQADRDRVDRERQRRFVRKCQGRKDPEPRECLHCLEMFQPTDGRGKPQYCQRAECQEALRAIRKSKKLAYLRAHYRDKYESTAVFIAPGEKVSKCRVCGRLTPNRFGRCSECLRDHVIEAGADLCVGNMARGIYDLTEPWTREDRLRA